MWDVSKPSLLPQVVEEEEGQTPEVMVYEIFGFKGKTLPYSLAIVGSPGYEEIERDAIIRRRLSEILQVDHIGDVVVCLLMTAGESPQSSRLKNTYDSVKSLFRDQRDRCTIILITNSERTNPTNILQDLETTKIKYVKNDKRDPFYFLLNNRQHEDRTGNIDELEQAYKLSDKELGKFLKNLLRAGSGCGFSMKELSAAPSVKKTLIILDARRQDASRLR
ncbi:hypothetical protein XENOCAPTIV_004416 [Xenoophorus captivus]|uniref:AIG1-type G domain-containing protein n=1 Tax=Xenoophorus captivus TaxID=1517983 RepID=A0ABV0QHF7_9TELE